MMSRIKSIFLVLLVTLVVLLSVGNGWILYERQKDPLRVIDQPSGAVSSSVSNVTSAFDDERNYQHIELHSENLGTIEAFVSMPKHLPESGLPVVLIMGGLEIDIEDFKLIHNPGENIFVIFNYPYSPEYWYKGAPLEEIPAIRQVVLKVPAQALNLYQWVHGQPWSDDERVTFAGFSFGAMFIPAIFHLAEHRNIDMNPGIIAYAGVDISDLLTTNLDQLSWPVRWFAGWLGESLIYAVEPALHLSKLHNEFLIMNGTKDHQISTYSWQRLHQLTPDPKTIIILDEGHMHPRKPELTRKLVDISREWLKERGLVN